MSASTFVHAARVRVGDVLLDEQGCPVGRVLLARPAKANGWTVLHVDGPDGPEQCIRIYHREDRLPVVRAAEQ